MEYLKQGRKQKEKFLNGSQFFITGKDFIPRLGINRRSILSWSMALFVLNSEYTFGGEDQFNERGVNLIRGMGR